MIEKLKAIIEEEVKNLPKVWQDAINFSRWDSITEEIGKRNLLTDNEINDLQTETVLVLIGLEDSDSLMINIESNVGLSKNEALKISEEINKKILTPVYEKIELPAQNNSIISENTSKKDDIPLPPYVQTETKPIEQPKVVENRPIEPVVTTTPKQEFVPIQKQTENIEPVTQPLESNKAPNILEEKLSRPTVNTETVSNYSNPKVDPYREQF